MSMSNTYTPQYILRSDWRGGRSIYRVGPRGGQYFVASYRDPEVAQSVLEVLQNWADWESS